MKRLLTYFITLLLVFGVAGNAMASRMYLDVYGSEEKKMSVDADCDFIEWDFDITDNGFDPKYQDVTDASICLAISDDYLMDDHRILYELKNGELDQEKARFHYVGETTEFEVDFWRKVTVSESGLEELSENGTLHCELRVLSGDFKFCFATLTAKGTNPTTPVPEPATMILLGTGLTGLAVVSRKRK